MSITFSWTNWNGSNLRLPVGARATAAPLLAATHRRTLAKVSRGLVFSAVLFLVLNCCYNNLVGWL